MTNKQKHPISLSQMSIREVVTLCKTIKTKNPKNEISVNMADGISAFVEQNAFVTERQASWLCRNADFWKIKRPVELADVVVEPKAKPQVAAPTVETTIPESEQDWRKQMVSSLERIEKLLEVRK